MHIAVAAVVAFLDPDANIIFQSTPYSGNTVRLTIAVSIIKEEKFRNTHSFHEECVIESGMSQEIAFILYLT